MASNLTSFEDDLDHFGPQLPGHFDFSPLFEISILSILPSAIFLVVVPFRLKVLFKQSRKVSRSILHGNKLVGSLRRINPRADFTIDPTCGFHRTPMRTLDSLRSQFRCQEASFVGCCYARLHRWSRLMPPLPL